MNLNRKNVKKIRGLLLFAAGLCLVLMKFDVLWVGAVILLQMIKPFLVGGAIAFIINLPMRFYERHLFPANKTGKRAAALKRPVCLTLAFVSVVLVIGVVAATVVPQLIRTVSVLAKEVPVFVEGVLDSLNGILRENPDLQGQIQNILPQEINWQSTFVKIGKFLQNGMGSMLTSTVTAASGLISGTVNFFISFIFSIYILSQKEKLEDQCRRLLRAYVKPDVCQWIFKVASLLHQNFSRFITGQCTEAVILGAMFIVAMTIGGMPFAVMIGVLIAFTALIPIVGAFIGCFIGTFLILVDSPAKAVGFVVLFLVLQQVEGNLIYPHVVGNSVGLPSIWVLAAVTIGGSLMGVVGMLIFIPLLSTVYMLLREDVNRRNKAAQKEQKHGEKDRNEEEADDTI